MYCDHVHISTVNSICINNNKTSGFQTNKCQTGEQKINEKTHMNIPAVLNSYQSRQTEKKPLFDYIPRVII